MPPTIVVLTCPVCAAPIRPESSRCDFCGSVVVIQTDHPRLEPHLLNKAMIDDHITKFRVRVRHDLNDEAAHYGLGVAYFNLGLLDDAAEELSQAAHLMPENPHIQLQLAVVYADIAKSDQPEAVKSAWTRLNRALLLQPNLAEALLLKADLQLREKQPEQAIMTWRQAETAQAGSPRERIVSFLKTHDSVLQQSPAFSASAAQRVHEESIQASRTKYKRLAIGAIALGAFLVLMALSANSGVAALVFTVATVAIAAALVRTRNRRWPKSSQSLTDSWNASELRRQRLATMNVDMTELFTAADYVASQLALKIRPQASVALTERASRQAVVPARPIARPVAWETCEIVIKETVFHGASFEVQVTGPHGKHLLDGHGGGGQRTRRGSEQFVKQMADELMAEGWEPLPKGKKWWSYRFRRPVL